MKIKLVCLTFLILLGGCGMLASKTEQVFPRAEYGKIDSEKALIVVTRKRQNEAQAHQVELMDGDVSIGLLGVGSEVTEGEHSNKLIWFRDPGEMNLKLTPKTMVKDLPPILVTVEAGKQYDFEVLFKYSPYGLQLIEK